VREISRGSALARISGDDLILVHRDNSPTHLWVNSFFHAATVSLLA
jgi:hypothetical protein